MTIDIGMLDTIATAFSVAMDGAYGTLHAYSLGLLSVLAIIHLYLALGRMLSQGGTANLAALGEFLWVAIRIGIFVFISTVLYDLMWNGAFMTFLNWGLEAGGGTFSLGEFLNPSSIVEAGFRVVGPLFDFLKNMSGPGKLWKIDIVLVYTAAAVVVILAYAAIALAAMMTLIEVKLAIATSAILIPWAVLTQTAVLGELSLSWLTACLVRVLLTAAIMAIGVPLFKILALAAGTDPTLVQAVMIAVAAVVFAGLAWVLPARAASIGGRGMALALGSDVVIGAGTAGVSGARYAYHSGQAAIRGVSEMMPQRSAP